MLGTEKKRNAGLDILRIVSMLMITMLHALGKGGALWETDMMTFNWYYSWGLEAVCYGATNCYVLISGYFLAASKEMKWKKIFSIMAEVWAYSVAVLLILLAFGFRPDRYQIIYSLVPFFSKTYWFIDAYILMYVLHPFVNRLLDHLSQKEYKRLLLIVFIFFSIAQTVTPHPEWTMDDSWGYGIIWFECLYLVAAYIRRYGVSEKLSKLRCFFGFAGCSAAVLVFRTVVLKLVWILGLTEAYADLWYSYNSVPVFLASIFMFLFFLKLDVKENRIISFAAAATLAVYLIQEQGFMRSVLWKDILHIDRWTNTALQPVMVVVYALGVFLGGLVISCLVKGVIKFIKTKRAAAGK